jgi:hypothetical protein
LAIERFSYLLFEFFSKTLNQYSIVGKTCKNKKGKMKNEKMKEEKKDTGETRPVSGGNAIEGANEKIDLNLYLELVREKLENFDDAAEDYAIQGWTSLKEKVIRAVQEIAVDPNATAYAISGDDIHIPNGLSPEESADCFAENFFLCALEDVPKKGEMAVQEFASDVVQ